MLKHDVLYEKSIAEGTLRVIPIEDEFNLLLTDNDFDSPTQWKKDVSSKFIQFHFCLVGNVKFVFNGGNYTISLPADKALLLYNPNQDLPINVEIASGTRMVSILISIKKFHSLFTNEADYIPFLSEENKNKKYYTEHPIAPGLSIVLSQLFTANLNENIRPLYFKAKAYELLSLYLNKTEETNTERCPFLVDEDNVDKIRKAKDLVIANMANPPGLEELSEAVGLSLKKLKVGFKQLYGDTVFNFLLDYKLDYAQKLLDSQEYNVAEVGALIGYTSSSHFIEAFRKKFSITPKKYLQAKSDQ